jgi:hypothetical protein
MRPLINRILNYLWIILILWLYVTIYMSMLCANFQTIWRWSAYLTNLFLFWGGPSGLMPINASIILIFGMHTIKYIVMSCANYESCSFAMGHENRFLIFLHPLSQSAISTHRIRLIFWYCRLPNICKLCAENQPNPSSPSFCGNFHFQNKGHSCN